ncbi:MAG: TrmB family transcriptional regulator [Nanoarchaeota archaeon]|nr:MAG: TrmB family transcriptional regulator [Nanoarchaeota archaeon]
MEDALAELGFSKNEAKVYLAINELGSTTATRIADKAKLHRTNVYEAVSRLIEKGLVSYFIRDNVKFYETTNPENILNNIKMKEARAHEVIPQLKIREQLSQREGFSTVLKGTQAFMNALYNQLEYKKPVNVYGIPKDAIELMKNQIPHFHKERIKRKILMRHIYNFDAVDRIKYLNTLPYTEARYIDDQFKSLVATQVCGDEVLVVLMINPIFAVRIVNKQIAETYQHYFEILWKNARIPK